MASTPDSSSSLRPFTATTTVPLPRLSPLFFRQKRVGPWPSHTTHLVAVVLDRTRARSRERRRDAPSQNRSLSLSLFLSLSLSLSTRGRRARLRETETSAASSSAMGKLLMNKQARAARRSRTCSGAGESSCVVQSVEISLRLGTASLDVSDLTTCSIDEVRMSCGIFQNTLRRPNRTPETSRDAALPGKRANRVPVGREQARVHFGHRCAGRAARQGVDAHAQVPLGRVPQCPPASNASSIGRVRIELGQRTRLGLGSNDDDY